MSDQPAAEQQAIPLVINVQYIKDMSFEVPNAPAVFTQPRNNPNVAINLDVQARRIQEGQPHYEVTLVIRTEATMPGGNGTNGAVPSADAPTQASPVLFVAELAYAGVFTLQGVPDQAIEPVLLVECPRLLFPFARNILSDVTRDGGFPPVLLQPIDFLALWQARRAQAGQPPVS